MWKDRRNSIVAFHHPVAKVRKFGKWCVLCLSLWKKRYFCWKLKWQFVPNTSLVVQKENKKTAWIVLFSELLAAKRPVPNGCAQLVLKLNKNPKMKMWSVLKIALLFCKNADLVQRSILLFEASQQACRSSVSAATRCDVVAMTVEFLCSGTVQADGLEHAADWAMVAATPGPGQSVRADALQGDDVEVHHLPLPLLLRTRRPVESKWRQ